MTERHCLAHHYSVRQLQLIVSICFEWTSCHHVNVQEVSALDASCILLDTRPMRVFVMLFRHCRLYVLTFQNMHRPLLACARRTCLKLPAAPPCMDAWPCSGVVPVLEARLKKLVKLPLLLNQLRLHGAQHTTSAIVQARRNLTPVQRQTQQAAVLLTRCECTAHSILHQ